MGMQNIIAAGRPFLLFLCIATLLLAGCATYHAHPLPEDSMLAKSLQSLQYTIDKMQTGKLQQYDINPADGLDLTEVAILAVLNNPALKAERTRLQVAGAQVFAAGLLPDPQISTNIDFPTGDTTGAINAWGAGLGYDLIPLITRQSRIDAEQKGKIQVNLELLWQEWQVMQRARSLVVYLTMERRKLALLQTMKNLYLQRYDNSTQAMSRGDVTLDVNGTDLTALIDTYSQINQLEQIHNETRHKLNLLLGLAPDVELRLHLPGKLTLIDRQKADEKINDLQNKRPDLLALKAGYQSQEAKVRTAILAQFPSLSIGITRARDSGRLYTTGFGVSLNLPLFSGNRGIIAVERATREQLKEEYQARLSQTLIDVDKLLQLQEIISRQQVHLRKYLPYLLSIVEKAREAYKNGDIDALTFLNMETTWTNKRLEQISLEQSQWGNRIALQTLLAMPGTTIPQQLSKTRDK